MSNNFLHFFLKIYTRERERERSLIKAINYKYYIENIFLKTIKIAANFELQKSIFYQKIPIFDRP